MSANVVRAMRTRCRTRVRTSARMRMENGKWRMGKGNGRKIKMKMKIQNEICTFSRMVACPPEQICQLAKQNEYTHMLTHTHSLTCTCSHSHTDKHVHTHSHIANDHRKATKFAYQVRVLLRGCRGAWGMLLGCSELYLGIPCCIWGQH